MTSFYKEVERARGSIERHVGNLMANQERLDEEYVSLSGYLLSRADDFGPEEFGTFRRLGRLRRLRKLNLTTVLSLQYLRMCIWLMMDGMELDEPPNPAKAIRRLREVNEALAGSSNSQVKCLERSVMKHMTRFLEDRSDYAKPISFALKAVDEDVVHIFGEAICVSATEN
jgi:hypothetical protein